MHVTEKQTQTFFTDSKEDMEGYDAILNDPLCFIVRELHEKISEKSFNEETGKLEFIRERMALVVTWQRKKLL